MTQLQGTIDERFESLAEIVQGQLASGDDLGASLAVTVEGQMVTDCWGGWTDEGETEPWRSDTIANVFSTTKAMTALCALVLIDRGQLDPNERVAAYWPEFGANGKQNIEVRHVLAHTSGVSGWAQPVTSDDVLDDERATEMLARQAPWWEPGTSSGYHMANWGHLVGEIVRRVDGRGLTQFFAEEVAGPLDADFTIGSPESEHGRISPLITPPRQPLPDDLDLDSVVGKTLTGPEFDLSIANTTAWRKATIGAANGHGNARSVAAVQAVVSNGGRVGDVELLSQATIERMMTPQISGTDLILGELITWGLGYAVGHPADDLGVTSGRVCYFTGGGGSVVINDLDGRVTMAYVMNRMRSPNETRLALVSALGSILGWPASQIGHDG